jgi:signal transduction histidine kinase
MLIITTALLVAMVVAVTGGLILWSNPSRPVNRAVFGGTLQMAAWLVCWHLAATSKEDGLFWLKWTCSVGALGPFNFWVVKEVIALDITRSLRSWLARSWLWILAPTALALIPFTDSFIPPESTKFKPIYGWGYYGFIWGQLCLYAILFRDTFKKLRTLSGAPRLELQVWLGGGCILALAIYVSMGLSAITSDPSYRRLQPLSVLLFYAGTAYFVTSFRIFDARQILRVTLEKALLVCGVAAAAFLLHAAFSLLLAKPIAFLGTIVGGLWIAGLINTRLNRLFNFYPQEITARKAVLEAAKRETRTDALESSFVSILKGWAHSDDAFIHTSVKDQMLFGEEELEKNGPVLSAMRRLRWATPERLARERSSVERQALKEFLASRRLGVLVLEQGTSLTALVGVGEGASRRPYTYPQVTHLMELTSIIAGALERAHFSAKVQHAEQLATVGLLGASLAHEIRNPLVSIKTFVQLLPTHYHDPVFREKFFRLIGDEVGRIDQLTEQLLDLASPRTYASEVVELHPLLRASLELVAAKAGHRNVQLLTDFGAVPDAAYTDASAAKQVMLNLCFNAIQAVESHSAGDKWVRIATRNTGQGIEMLVADSGPGISEDIRPRLFQPFQTTKSTGFGLGLAICSDILTNLNATISVDPSEPGRGATFRVIFPCQPLSS